MGAFITQVLWSACHCEGMPFIDLQCTVKVPVTLGSQKLKHVEMMFQVFTFYSLFL